jgi:hypothetical protein
MEGIKQIIDECWKIIKNPQEHECKAMEAMQIALEANVQLCNMLKSMKEQYYPAADTDHNSSDYDYGRQHQKAPEYFTLESGRQLYEGFFK